MPLRPPAGYIPPRYASNYSGVWNLAAQLQAIAGQNWPMGPGAPTGVVASAGDAQLVVTFTAPAFTGVPPGITGYRAIASPGGASTTGASSPLTVTGLTNGTSYTVSVEATNGVQYGPAGVSGSVAPAAPRGLFAGGQGPSGDTNVINYITLSTTGNAADFGDLSIARKYVAACSSSSRALFGGGMAGSQTGLIEYVTVSTTGNATSFGSLTQSRWGAAGCSNSTRGLFGGGYDDSGGVYVNTIDYVTIAATGNATDFGDLSGGLRIRRLGACANSTRGLFISGQDQGGGATSQSDYVTLATTGNATGFGNVSVPRYGLAAASSSTRGVAAGGYTGASNSNVIDYYTIASPGNSTDFGDLALATLDISACSSPTLAIFAGGDSPSRTNVISYVTIATTGNATDFGDLTQATDAGPGGCSSAHGGL